MNSCAKNTHVNFNFVLCSSWYTNGDYLVLIVTVAIILPLSLLKNLGKSSFYERG